MRSVIKAKNTRIDFRCTESLPSNKFPGEVHNPRGQATRPPNVGCT